MAQCIWRSSFRRGIQQKGIEGFLIEQTEAYMEMESCENERHEEKVWEVHTTQKWAKQWQQHKRLHGTVKIPYIFSMHWHLWLDLYRWDTSAEVGFRCLSSKIRYSASSLSVKPAYQDTQLLLLKRADISSTILILISFTSVHIYG